MDLTSYAELAVRLVNTSARVSDEPAWLGSPQAFRALVADRLNLSGPVTRHDLDALRLLRDDLAAIFTAAAAGDEAAAAERLNALLVRHPIQPVMVRHDGTRWHLHLTQSGSVADRYAADAAAGLAMLISQLGISRLGICAIASCQGAYIDASTNASRRYCSDHCTTRANVTAFRARGGSATGDAASKAVG